MHPNTLDVISDLITIFAYQHLGSGDALSTLENGIKEIVNEELKACSNIALALDSKRGNEKVIAKFIFERQLGD